MFPIPWGRPWTYDTYGFSGPSYAQKLWIHPMAFIGKAAEHIATPLLISLRPLIKASGH